MSCVGEWDQRMAGQFTAMGSAIPGFILVGIKRLSGRQGGQDMGHSYSLLEGIDVWDSCPKWQCLDFSVAIVCSK